MRFIYNYNDILTGRNMVMHSYRYNGMNIYFGNFIIEDTQNNIIWLINSQEAYKEMERYYEKC